MSGVKQELVELNRILEAMGDPEVVPNQFYSVIEELQYVRSIRTKVGCMEEEIARIRAHCDYPKGFDYRLLSDPKYTDLPIDRLGDGVLTMLERTCTLYTRIKILHALSDKWEENFLKIAEPYRSALTCYYIYGYTWKDTAEEIGKSYYHVVNRIHPNGVNWLQCMRNHGRL